jgi:hypothetical protein
MPPLRPRGGINAAEHCAMRHTVAASLAPRRAAEAHRAARATRIAARSTQRAARTSTADGQVLAAHAAGLRAPANRPPQGAPTPGSTAPFKPSRTDPLNREPAAKPATASFKPFRTDPLNREPGAFPDPDPQPVHHCHETAQTRECTQRPAHAEPAPQARNPCRDDRR